MKLNEKKNVELRYDLLNAMNLIVSSMNNEAAYYNSGWLYIWPDGADEEEICEMAESDYFDEVAETFFRVCERFGNDGFYTTTF